MEAQLFNNKRHYMDKIISLKQDIKESGRAKKNFIRRAGFTLVELALVIAIMGVVLTGLLGAFIACFALNETSENLTIAINGAQVKMEEIRNHVDTVNDFGVLITDYSPGGVIGNTFTIDPVNWLGAVNQSAVIYILDPQSGIILNTGPTADPGLDLYDIRITVCWRQKGGRIVGEDSNLDGVLNAGEDTSTVNNILDSPAQIITLIAKR